MPEGPSDIHAVLLKMIVDQTGVPPPSICHQSRLAEDLGMDGDDAAEFFERFEQQFSADLSELHERWNCYFAPEGMSLKQGLLIALMTAPGIALGISLELGRILSVALGIVSAFMLIWLRSDLKPSHDACGITVADLEAAIATGKLTLARSDA